MCFCILICHCWTPIRPSAAFNLPRASSLAIYKQWFLDPPLCPLDLGHRYVILLKKNPDQSHFLLYTFIKFVHRENAGTIPRVPPFPLWPLWCQRHPTFHHKKATTWREPPFSLAVSRAATIPGVKALESMQA